MDKIIFVASILFLVTLFGCSNTDTNNKQGNSNTEGYDTVPVSSDQSNSVWKSRSGIKAPDPIKLDSNNK